MTEDSGSTGQPLSGVRVLDIGRYIAGPFCSRLLARLGADVIKVEPPGQGDPGRLVGPFRPGASRGETGPLHFYVDEGKRGITLDLRSASGRELFLRLADLSDVVVENFEPRVLQDLRLAYETLATRNRRLVLTSISNFGGSGPYRDYKGRELTLFAMGGHVYRSGTLGRPPLRMGGNPSQYLAAITAAYATLLALRISEETGLGQQVDFSIFESQVTSHAQAMVEVSYYGEESGAHAPRGAGQGHRLMAKDGPVMFSVQEQQMPSLASLVGAPPELGRPNPMERASGRAALQEYIERWASTRSKVEFYQEAQKAHVPASYVASPSDLLASPQFRQRGFFLKYEHPQAEQVEVPGVPFAWRGLAVPPRPAPLLGQHNEEVYCGLLGLSKHDLVKLSGAGVI